MRESRQDDVLDELPKPTLLEFLEKTLWFKLHGWQENHLVPILEQLVSPGSASPESASPGCAGVPPASETTPKAKPGHRTQHIGHPRSEPITHHSSPITPGAPGKRILVHAPPQYGKSIIVSKRFPAWALGMNPKLRIVLAGYSLDHAAGFTETVRDTMASQTYQDLFPHQDNVIQKSASRESFSTAARKRLRDGQASVTAVGLLSGFTGKGADILIIDDPYASPDDARSEAINERVWRWWNELAKVRIDDKSNVLVMFHRYHEDDFAGRLIAQGGWQYYRFPAIADSTERTVPADTGCAGFQPASGPPPQAEQRQTSSHAGAAGGPGYADVPSASEPPPPAEHPQASTFGGASERGPGCRAKRDPEKRDAGVPSASETPPKAEPGHRTQDTGHPEDKNALADRSEVRGYPRIPDESSDDIGTEGGQRNLNPGDGSASEARPTIASANPPKAEDDPTRHASPVTRHAEGLDPTARRPGELLSPMRSRAYLKEIEDHDPMVWLGQFQGRPRAPEGAFIKREWIKEIPAHQIPRLALWVRFWDLATKADQKADFYAGALVGVGPDQTVYIRDVTRFRGEWPDARDIIAETTRRDSLLCQESGAQYEVGVEQVAWMRGMIQDLFTLPIFQNVRLTPVKPDGDKKERSSGWVSRARNDMLRISKDYWNVDFINECLAFDGQGHTHDDQIDSVSGAYSLLWSLKGQLIQEEQLPAPGSYRFYKELAKANRWGTYAEEEDEGGFYFYE